MSFFFKKNPNESNYTGGKKHWADVIKNTSVANNLIWRQPEEDFNTNSTLIVNPGEEAVFIKGGNIEEVFTNGTYKLSTENYPFISRLRNAFTGGISAFNCLVYFVRTASSLEISWGTDSSIQVRDKLLGIQTNLMARGSYRVKVSNAGKFLTHLIGNNVDMLSPDGLEEYFGQQFITDIKSVIANYINTTESEILGISAHQREISDAISPILRETLDEYGLELIKFSIAGLDLADDNLRRRYDEIGMDAIAKLRNAQADRSVMDIMGDKWAAQQQVDILKQMAANSDISGTAAALGTGVAAGFAGFAMGQQVLGSNLGQPQQATAPVPPPIPSNKTYYLAINGQQVGPINASMLPSYIGNGLTPQTLVWCEGMANWAAAASVPEVAALFGPAVPPPLP